MADNDFWVKPKDIPLDLNLLRYAGDGPVAEQIRVYTTTALNTNFARPCFAIAPRGDAETEYPVEVFEETMHRLLDNGATPDDLYRIMGLVQRDELDEDQLAYEEYVEIDLGYCIPGLVDSYETVPDSVASVTNAISPAQFVQFERAIDSGASFKDAMKVTENAYDSFQADEVVRAASLNLPASVMEAIADPKRGAGEMRVLTDIARDGEDIKPYLDLKNDPAMESKGGFRILTVHDLSHTLGDDCPPFEKLKALSDEQLLALRIATDEIHFHATEGILPKQLIPFLAESKVIPEATTRVSMYAREGRIPTARWVAILRDFDDPEQMLALLDMAHENPGIAALSDEQFATLFTPDMKPGTMRSCGMAINPALAPAISVLAPATVAGLKANHDLDAFAPGSLDALLAAAASPSVPAETVNLMADRPDLSSMQIHEVIVAAESGKGADELAQVLFGFGGKGAPANQPSVPTAKSPDLDSESRDMESAKEAVNNPEQDAETPEKTTGKPEH